MSVAAIRFYETIRFVIWHAFEGENGVPRSFEIFLKSDNNRQCKLLPVSLSKQLEFSWEKSGKKAKEYRDCFQHYVPIGGYSSDAQMKRLEGRVWSASIIIPDNPEDKSQRKYKYDSKIDALEYGWKITNEIMELAHTIIDELPSNE